MFNERLILTLLNIKGLGRKTVNKILQWKIPDSLREEDLLKGDINSQIENVSQIIKKLAKSGISKDEMVISFLHDKSYKTNSNESCKVLYELAKHFDGYKLGIEAGDITWSSEKIVNANKKLDKIVEDIKSKNLSKLEQLFLAYNIITQKMYKEVEHNESLYTSREIYGVLNSDTIVCVGYVEILKEIMARLGLGNDIQIFSNKVKLPNKYKTEYHETCIIYIKDEKYNLDGYYYCDPTWDSRRDGDTSVRLTYFMLPIREIRNINSYLFYLLFQHQLPFVPSVYFLLALFFLLLPIQQF